MNSEEKHQREMNMNAHFCWSLAMWGSADIAREQSNYIVACYGYYYSVFHAGFALICTDHSYHAEDMQQMKHSKIESWLSDRLPWKLAMDFSLLRRYREVTSYLGMEQPARKLQVVRGHPFGFTDSQKSYTFFEAVGEAKEASTRVILFILDEIEKFCLQNQWRGPKRNDEHWLDEYLQEDILLNVIPRDQNGIAILQRSFSLLKSQSKPESS